MTPTIDFLRQLLAKLRGQTSRPASEDEFRSLFENVPDGVFQSSPCGRILAANPALVRMLGFASEAELIDAYRRYELRAELERRARHSNDPECEGHLRNVVEVALILKDMLPITVLENFWVVRDPGANGTQ